MAADQELQRHVETWHSFAQLMKWSVISIVALLLIMAAALL